MDKIIVGDVTIRDSEGNVKKIISKATLRTAQKYAKQRTKHEVWLYNYLCRYRKKLGITLIQQGIYHNDTTFYLSDIYIPKARLVIEVDGQSHQSKEQQARDRQKDKFYNDKGIRVVRVSNDDVQSNKYVVANKLTNIIRSQLSKAQ